MKHKNKLYLEPDILLPAPKKIKGESKMEKDTFYIRENYDGEGRRADLREDLFFDGEYPEPDYFGEHCIEGAVDVIYHNGSGLIGCSPRDDVMTRIKTACVEAHEAGKDRIIWNP